MKKVIFLLLLLGCISCSTKQEFKNGDYVKLSGDNQNIQYIYCGQMPNGSAILVDAQGKKYFAKMEDLRK